MGSLVAIPTSAASCSNVFQIQDYDLTATLTSGQAFRWRRDGESWLGVIGTHWVRLQARDQTILAEAAEPVSDWSWLTDYLQFDLNLQEMLNPVRRGLDG